MRKQYYSMEKTGNEANINIYGDIYSYPWEECGQVGADSFVKKLEKMGEVSKINVYINSYGGEVAEGLAIYNALKRHKAKVTTYCDGFAASIASVIFMAGDERIMNSSSLLMIHNAWSWGEGNAEQLRKQADDLDKITQASVTAYAEHSNLSKEEIQSLMDDETWILPDEALEYGFATAIEKAAKSAASQNAKKRLIDIVKQYKEANNEDEKEGEEKNPENQEDEETTKDPPEDEPEDEKTEDENKPENEQKPAEKISGFFKAFLNM